MVQPKILYHFSQDFPPTKCSPSHFERVDLFSAASCYSPRGAVHLPVLARGKPESQPLPRGASAAGGRTGLPSEYERKDSKSQTRHVYAEKRPGW